MATSPQVLFLRPIVAELRKRGRTLTITTRESTETVPLANRYGLEHFTIGAHGGSTLIGKGVAIALRAMQLANFVRTRDIRLAISHGSYSQSLAAGSMRIPFVSFQDYEGHPANHVLCRVAKKILVPDAFNKHNLHRYGAAESKIESYDGLKENVYLADFMPKTDFLSAEGIPKKRIIVTMRPPNLVATYHRFSNPLFDQLLHSISSHPNTFIVLLPRGSGQRRAYEMMQLSNVLIPDHVVDGPNLIFHSDLVVGAGGTMNREATVLGTPVYSLFRGELGSVDQHLIKSGKMLHIKGEGDIPKVRLQKKMKPRSALWRDRQGLVSNVVDRLLEVAT